MPYFEVLLITNEIGFTDRNPDIESLEFDTLEEAKEAFEKACSEECHEHGMECRVELWKRRDENDDDDDDNDDDDNDEYDEPLEEGEQDSAFLPEDGVIVTYKHVTHMNYAYQIELVRKVDGERYEDLEPSLDKVYTNWEKVYDSIEEMQRDYENKSGSPMDKIQSGRYLIEQFLAEEGVEGYYTEDDDDDEN